MVKKQKKQIDSLEDGSDADTYREMETWTGAEDHLED